MVSSKNVLLNIGPLDRFDDGQPDYLERLRQSFRDGAPLIPELLPYVGEKPAQNYTVTFGKGDGVFLGRLLPNVGQQFRN